MGADQPAPPKGPLTVSIIADFTKVAPGYPVEFTAQITGSALGTAWNLGDGMVMTNQPFVRRSWNAPGIYPVQLTGYNDTHPEGVTATLEVTVIEPTISYVDAAGTNPVFPYASWDTAATNIQDAIGAATLPGHLVLVTNGVYRTGMVEWTHISEPHGEFVERNRVALTNRVLVRSVNGPEVTVIEGSRSDPYTGEGIDVRCAYVGDGSVLSGFTLTKGSANWGYAAVSLGGGVLCHSFGVVTNCVLIGNIAERGNGGGVCGGTLVHCKLTDNRATGVSPEGKAVGGMGGGGYSCTLSNCVVTANSAWEGGGAFGGTLYNCTLADNRVSAWAGGDAKPFYAAGRGGGASESTLYNCTVTANSSNAVGGGAYRGTLYNCVLTGNSATGEYEGRGGGASSSTLYNCTVTGNSATGELASGGGVSGGTLYNCTVTGNSATGEYGSSGGVVGGTLYNCIVYFNQAPNGPDWSVDWNGNPTKFASSCTAPLPEGPGNIAADPLFVNAATGDFRLQSDSPCIDAGTNLVGLVFLDPWTGEERPYAPAEMPIPQDGNGDGVARFDMGAIEFDPTVPFITRVVLTPEGLRIEWQATAIGATLQHSATLNPPAWQDVPGSETVTTVTVPVTQAQEFFRLLKR